jgi:hypothetical protein
MTNSTLQHRLMQVSLLIIPICLLSLLAIDRPKVAIAQSEVEFFCGFTEETDQQPATMVANKGHQRAIVLWKYPLGKQTPKERCYQVSPLFRKAWTEHRLNLVSGVDRKTGQGLICAVKKGENTCERKNQLFALRSGTDAKETISRLYDSMHRAGNPILQSSSSESIDMQELIDSMGK